MKTYWSFFRIRFINSLQYRAAALAGVCTQFAWGGLFILMFRAFYQADPASFPMDFSALSSYIWLQQALLMLFNVWRLDNKIFEAITGGNVAYEMARPVSLYNMWFTTNLAERFAQTALRCIPVLLVASFLPEPYGLSLPADPFTFLVFVVTLFGGGLLVVAFAMMIYISTFYTMAPGGGGIKMIGMMLVDLLTGQLIPLPFFPDSLQAVLKFTPFSAMQNLPLRIYSGDIAGAEMVQGVLLQAFWLLFFIAVGKWWLSSAQKRVVVQGG